MLVGGGGVGVPEVGHLGVFPLVLVGVGLRTSGHGDGHQRHGSDEDISENSFHDCLDDLGMLESVVGGNIVDRLAQELRRGGRGGCGDG